MLVFQFIAESSKFIFIMLVFGLSALLNKNEIIKKKKVENTLMYDAKYSSFCLKFGWVLVTASVISIRNSLFKLR